MDRDLVIDVGDIDSAADDLVAPCHGSAAVGPSLDGVARGGTWPANGSGSGLLLQQGGASGVNFGRSARRLVLARGGRVEWRGRDGAGQRR